MGARVLINGTRYNKVEAAYRRGALLEKRRRLMADWAAYCNAAAPVGYVAPAQAPGLNQ